MEIEKGSLKPKNRAPRKSLMNSLTPDEQKKYQQFFKVLSQHKQEQLARRLKSYHGKNVPVSYKPQYKFTQQWQNKESSSLFDSSNRIETKGSFYILYSLITIVLNVFGIWTITVERYFGTREISLNGPIYQLLISLNLIDMVIKCYLKYAESFNLPAINEFIMNFYSHLLLILYFSLMLFLDVRHFIMNLAEFVVIYFLYRKAAQIYGYIRILEFCLQYEHYIKITDLLFNIFIQAHLFAIVLFITSKIDPANNWVKYIGIEHQNYMVKYINAVYFACTTILTIGYGDISPKNSEEKLVTIIIEIVGVIAFGYLLNEMGHTLSKMREQKDLMERDLQTISKISKYYNLQAKLQNKARTFILNNQRNNEELKIEDENKLLMKLNQDLREEINLENSLNVVKSCIFYLCHWSKNMQTEIAQKLEKRVFAPNEKITSSNQKERIYIIKKGKMNVSMSRYGADQEHRKILKVIDMNQKSSLEVCDNIYGYTSIFSNRPVKLEAVAKDFTSTYSVNKDDFLFCVNQNKKDFQYYHQIKSRIDQSAFCEEWEAPAIKNIRQHFCPSHLLTLKKYKKSLESDQNSRSFQIRQKKNKFSLLSRYYNVNRYGAETASFSQKTIIFDNQPTKTDNDFQFNEMTDPIKEQTSLESKNYECINIDAFASLRFRYLRECSEEKRQFEESFEAVKQYSNFFNKNNLSNVLYALQKQNPIEKRFGVNEQKSQTKLMNEGLI